ncbi:MAG: hypothetical protein ACO4CG_11955 [Prochlorothrix sp.]|nr:hypothetical protein [Prochlorothrix sp.]
MSTFKTAPLENSLSKRKAALSPLGTGIIKLDANLDRLKKLYQANHQAEFLYLQAEADTLLCQLETEIRVRRLAHTH